MLDYRGTRTYQSKEERSYITAKINSRKMANKNVGRNFNKRDLLRMILRANACCGGQQFNLNNLSAQKKRNYLHENLQYN